MSADAESTPSPAPLSTGLPLVALWSAPRCRSTAFLRMMAERGDHAIVHEPFSQVVDFGEATVGGMRVASENDVIDELMALAQRGPTFFKDTTDFRYPRLLEREDFLSAARHAVILRHPAEAIASHHALNPRLERDEIGFERLAEIHDRVVDLGGTPVVIDSDDLLRDPDRTVRAVCSALGIVFLPEALTWDAGLREDWSRTSRWHESTSRSTGFTSPSATATERSEATDTVADEPRLAGFVEYHLPFYRHLHERRLRV